MRCDIPSPGYQLTFESNTQWREFYASGAEIQRYIVNLAKRYDAYRFCRFQHELTEARWLEGPGKWECTFRQVNTGKVSIEYNFPPLLSPGLASFINCGHASVDRDRPSGCYYARHGPFE